jgi:DNA-binding SARP family transcriptional activator
MRSAQADVFHLSLVPGFACQRNLELIDLGDTQQKLVASLALDGGTVQREDLAYRFWPDVPVIRAMARLRQTLWRLNTATYGQLITASATTVSLTSQVQVDYRCAKGAVGLLARPDTWGREDGELLAAWDTLRHPLLPGWDFDWLTAFQEAWELWRVQALERLAQTFLHRNQHALVLEFADAAARIDPLREGPRRAAIQSCLQAGEIADAHRRYRQYQQLLREELGVSPSDAIPRMLWQAREERAARLEQAGIRVTGVQSGSFQAAGQRV